MDGRDIVIDWLRDAYAMESYAGETLARQSERLRGHAEFAARVKKHRDESRRQAGMLRHCLQDLGSDPSSLKAGLGWLSANLHSIVGAMAGDEVIKGALALYAFENYQIAAYRTLIVAAEQAELPSVRDTCRAILREEEAMQDWLAQHLPELAKDHLAHANATTGGAKR